MKLGYARVSMAEQNLALQIDALHAAGAERNRVEQMFGKLKQQRRIATRYDKTVLSLESFLNLAAARLWLQSFVNTA